MERISNVTLLWGKKLTKVSYFTDFMSDPLPYFVDSKIAHSIYIFYNWLPQNADFKTDSPTLLYI